MRTDLKFGYSYHFRCGAPYIYLPAFPCIFLGPSLLLHWLQPLFFLSISKRPLYRLSCPSTVLQGMKGRGRLSTRFTNRHCAMWLIQICLFFFLLKFTHTILAMRQFILTWLEITQGFKSFFFLISTNSDK